MIYDPEHADFCARLASLGADGAELINPLEDLIHQRMVEAEESAMRVVGRELLRGDHTELWRNVFYAVFGSRGIEPGAEIAFLLEDR